MPHGLGVLRPTLGLPKVLSIVIAGYEAFYLSGLISSFVIEQPHRSVALTCGTISAMRDKYHAVSVGILGRSGIAALFSLMLRRNFCKAMLLS